MKKNLFQIVIIAALGISFVSQSVVSEYLSESLSVEFKIQDKDGGESESGKSEIEKDSSEDKFFNSYAITIKGVTGFVFNEFSVKNSRALVISTEIPTPPPEFI